MDPYLWCRVSRDVEDRVMCREFIKRFRNILRIPKTHVDSLDTFDSFSEATCKALLIGLLDIIADDEPNASAKHEISAVVKRLRARQINLDQIWDAVHSLAPTCLTVPLAYPSPPRGEAARTTRVTRKGPDLVQARQLIPAINSLILEAVQTSFIRQEFDDGMKEITRLNKERAVRVKEETDRWIAVRKMFTQERENTRNDINQSALTNEEKKLKHKIEHSALSAKLRPAQDTHRIALLKINVHHLTDVQSNHLRYEPLGVDHEGRTYYALSHPQVSGKGSGANKGLSQSERNRLANWAYFVFVWGRRPADAPLEDGSDQDDEELWWAFNEATSIRQLSNWLLSTVLAREEVSGQISTGDAAQEISGISTDKDTKISKLSESREVLTNLPPRAKLFCGLAPFVRVFQTLRTFWT
ncbi:hypothetical protein BS47DRAFT_106873 [Hydnum rufescens UP504]|uniref:Uncharacterized protein n=1 Tax=Hydnum rufescens UP504 TaxID=1448309 RepID=A0A9P6ARB8_9AGAM|nr:hypothetical protein BS47DRAFT_106873 [Hydnum rufescens UP504]